MLTCDNPVTLGYRVKSLQGTQFRIWATQRLREYIVKGFTMDDERLNSRAAARISTNCWNAIFLPDHLFASIRSHWRLLKAEICGLDGRQIIRWMNVARHLKAQEEPAGAAL